MAGNMIGKVFNGRYRITELIGVGGMAEVYRAEDTVLGRVVAVKIMLPQYASDPDFTQRFRREASAAANLQSPYIVNVYDWGQDEGTYFIVMEYVRGTDLKTAINHRGAINERKVAQIGSQVCQALSVAHNLDIIHRDIKPQNIMIQPDGNVKVMDFGIARAKNSVGAKTSSVLGTAHYISPEQAQGKELTAASDIYSLGIVLYEAVTGRLPFDGPDAISVAMKQVSEEPVPPSEIVPSISPAFEDIILRAMQKNPDYRFATASEMRQALNDFLAGRPNQAFTSIPTAQMTPAGGLGSGVSDGSHTSVMPSVATYDQAGSDKQYRGDQGSSGGGVGKTVAIVVAVIAVVAIIGGLIWAFALNNPEGDTVIVPDVTGQERTQAERTIESSNLKVGSVSQVYNDEVAQGEVVSTTPKAGAVVDKGSAVNLTISRGKEQVQVPDVANMTVAEAQSSLSGAGLNLQEGAAEHSDTVEEGHIIRQDPSPGSSVDRGSTVNVIVSQGPEEPEGVEVPNVVGQTQSTASTNLYNAGLVPYITNQYSSTIGYGLVMWQTPVGGNLADPGSSVTICVSSGPDPSTTGSSSQTGSGGGYTGGGYTNGEYPGGTDTGSAGDNGGTGGGTTGGTGGTGGTGVGDGGYSGFGF